MPERLISGSGIKLYGRQIEGISLNAAELADEGLGHNQFLNQQVTHVVTCRPNPDPDPDDPTLAIPVISPILARIYGYSYNGGYCEMSSPTIFLVHGEGTPAAPDPVIENGRAHSSPPGNADESGVAAKSWDFVDDMRYWEYDKGDFLLRLDMSSGPLEQILLERESGGDSGEAYYSGKGHYSGKGSSSHR